MFDAVVSNAIPVMHSRAPQEFISSTLGLTTHFSIGSDVECNRAGAPNSFIPLMPEKIGVTLAVMIKSQVLKQLHTAHKNNKQINTAVH